MDIIKKYKISGAIGLSILKNNNKEIYIFYDQHNNNKYCNHKNSKFLNKIFEEYFLYSDSLILLEEPINDEVKNNNENSLITIWKETYHTVNFKKFFIKYNHLPNIIPFDLRTILFPISPFLIIIKDNKDELNKLEIDVNKLNNYTQNIKMEEYFNPFFYFFNILEINNDYLNKYDKIYKDLTTIKNKFNYCLQSIKLKKEMYIHLKKIKSIVLNFKEKFYDNNENITINEFIKKFGNKSYLTKFMYKNILNDTIIQQNFSWSDYLEIISDSIIEFFAILLILCNQKKYNFLHSGLAHSSCIVWLLRNHYNFDSVKDIGLNENYVDDNFKLPIVENCIGL